MALQHLYRQDSDRSKEEILWKCAAIYRAVRGAIVADWIGLDWNSYFTWGAFSHEATLPGTQDNTHTYT